MRVKVSTIRVKCRPWGHQFEFPILSDSSYGEFIYSNQNGKSYTYFNGINNNAWDFVQETISFNGKRIKDYGKTIQKIIGLIADKKEPTETFQNERIICPVCGRNAWHVYRDNVVGFIELEEMSFKRFEQLNLNERKREIEELI